MEALTDQLESRAMELIEKVDEMGGAERAVASGFFQEEIARSAYEFQLRVEAGETVIVGVNKFTDAAETPDIPSPDYSALEREQVLKLAAVRKARNSSRVTETLAALRAAAAADSGGGRTHLMPLIIEAVRARATVGEISDTLAACWGVYNPAL